MFVYIAESAVATDPVAPDAAVLAGKVLAAHRGVIEVSNRFEVIDYASSDGAVELE